MENLADIGKRVERLLYSSVVIMLASFLFYFLSSAITADNSSLKKSMITNFIDSINNKSQDLNLAKSLQETYKKYSDDSKNKTERQKKEEEEKKRLEIKNLNRTRLKLGLDEINIDKKLEEKPSSYDGLDIENINSLRKKLKLDNAKNIDGAKNIYNESIYTDCL